MLSAAQDLEFDDRRSSLQPVTIDKVPIIWNGNPAYALGALHEVKEFLVRKGLFQFLLEHNAVLLGNGKIAVDSLQAVPFVSDTIVDPVTYGFDSPCPSTTARIAAYDAHPVNATATPATVFVPIARMPTDYVGAYVISAPSIKQARNKLLECLSYIFGDLHKLERFTRLCAGDGCAMIALINTDAASAEAKDRALVRQRLNNYAQAGISTELTEETFHDYVKGLHTRNRQQPFGSRLTDEEIVMNIQGVVFKDPDVRQIYELSLKATPPGVSLDANMALILQILRSRSINSQIDDESNGKKSAIPNTALVLSSVSEPAAASQTALATIFAALSNASSSASATVSPLLSPRYRRSLPRPIHSKAVTTRKSLGRKTLVEAQIRRPEAEVAPRKARLGAEMAKLPSSQ